MHIHEIRIQYVRNIRFANILLHPHINVINGKNGSGKTAFLEALYLLSSARSFRTREVAPVITEGEQELRLHATTQSGQSIFLQKSKSQPTIAKINDKRCTLSSELACFLPCQLVYQDMFQFIDAGASLRRSLLDFGLFHVEPSYLPLFKEYQRALQQRNSLLKKSATKQMLTPWNQVLAHLAIQLHTLREAYFQKLQQAFIEILPCITDTSCQISYYKGWGANGEEDLLTLLEQGIAKDLQRQFTTFGAHQADIVLKSREKRAKLCLSRGQQKMILLAIKFAQIQLLEKSCIVLLDDIAAELDKEHLERIIQYIQKEPQQYFITAQTLDIWQEKLSLQDFLAISISGEIRSD